MVHILKADRYSVSPNVLDVGTKGSYGNDFIRLALSSDWDGLAVKISFYPARLAPIAVVCGDDDIEIPWEVYEYSGEVAAVISGEVADRIMISLPFILKIENTYTPANTPPREPTPSEISQVYEYMKAAVDTAKSVRDDADNGVFDGFSPTVEVTPIDGGYRVTITDEKGPHSFDIMSNGFDIGDGLKLDPATNTLSVKTPLPEPENSDNGKFLSIVGGKYALTELPKYDGTYEVTPQAETAVTLKTAEKYLSEDVTVKKIPYYEVDNESGGTTVYIGNDSEISIS